MKELFNTRRNMTNQTCIETKWFCAVVYLIMCLRWKALFSKCLARINWDKRKLFRAEILQKVTRAKKSLTTVCMFNLSSQFIWGSKDAGELLVCCIVLYPADVSGTHLEFFSVTLCSLWTPGVICRYAGFQNVWYRVRGLIAYPGLTSAWICSTQCRLRVP